MRNSVYSLITRQIRMCYKVDCNLLKRVMTPPMPFSARGNNIAIGMTCFTIFTSSGSQVRTVSRVLRLFLSCADFSCSRQSRPLSVAGGPLRHCTTSLLLPRPPGKQGGLLEQKNCVISDLLRTSRLRSWSARRIFLGNCYCRRIAGGSYS